MDASAGRNQTTKGIWMAKCVGIEPFTVAMDLEGTDGTERGEDDTTFEKQSALFALAVADIVLINICCQDIGREQASNKPLLKTMFQVMTQLFSPRKTTLLFVIRDKTQTPMEKLESRLREDIQKIWDLVCKSEAHKNTPLSEFFNVEVVALSHYVHQHKLFEQEVAELRRRFFHSISLGGLAGDRRDVVSASGLSISFKQIWERIKENKDLNIPAHKVFVATVRCEEIAKEKLQNLANDTSWLELQEAVKGGPVPHFGKKLSCILEKYFSEYDAEAIYFDEGVQKEKCIQLKLKSMDLVYPAYATMLGHLRSIALESCKIRLEESLNQGEGFAKAVRDSEESCLTVFDKGFDGESSDFSLCFKDAMVEKTTLDASKIKKKLYRDINTHSSSTRAAKLSELTDNYKKRLIQALGEPVASLFKAGGKETWPSIRKLLKQETETAIKDFRAVVADFELDHATTDAMVQNLKDYSQSLVEKKAREEEADKILSRMKDRFLRVLSHDKDSKPRVWTGKEDISAITKDARSEALSFLAVMAAIRLDEKPDKIESTLFSFLMDRNVGTSMDPLGSSSWEEVPPKYVLLTPVECNSLWTRLISETEYFVQEAANQNQTKKLISSLKTGAKVLGITVVGSVVGESCAVAAPFVAAAAPFVAAPYVAAAAAAVPTVAPAVPFVAAAVLPTVAVINAGAAGMRKLFD